MRCTRDLPQTNGDVSGRPRAAASPVATDVALSSVRATLPRVPDRVFALGTSVGTVQAARNEDRLDDRSGESVLRALHAVRSSSVSEEASHADW
jgi:hypothetical protein